MPCKLGPMPVHGVFLGVLPYCHIQLVHAAAFVLRVAQLSPFRTHSVRDLLELCVVHQRFP